MSNETNKLRVAIIHDWLTNFAGSEQVLLALHQMYPDAPIFTTVYKPEAVPQFSGADIRPSFLQRFPGAKNHHQAFFPLMPLAVEQFNLGEFDIVISSAHNCAKGVITKPETFHLCYCHTPTRYLWSNYHEYLRDSHFNFIVNKFIPPLSNKLRIWDFLAADRVDSFVANSKFTAGRILKYYKREAEIIPPPIDTNRFEISKNQEDYFFTAGRFIPYKKIDLIINAFNKLKLPLKIAGEGHEYKKLKALAGLNIEFLGRVSQEQLINLYSKCRAFVFAAQEDAGIVPLEAQASGRPIIAYGAGGSLETIIDGKTGLFFKEQTAESLISVVKRFRDESFNSKEIRAHAEKFSTENFKDKMKKVVEEGYQNYIKQLTV